MIVKLVEFKINFLREWLFRTAMSDGVLSDDELNILFSVDFNLTILKNAVLKAYKDQAIDKYAKERLGQIINQIKDDAYSSAKFDDSINQENQALIIILQYALIEFQKILIKGSR